MTTFSVPRVDISSLTVSQDLGRGGQGRVSAVDGFKVHGSWPAAVKIYANDQQRSADTSVLETMVALPRQLSDEDRSFLLENTAWPAVMAEDNGAVCGFLMRTVPSDFYFDFQYRTLGRQRKLADVAFLLNSEAYVRDAGIVVDDRQRLLLLKNVATLLTRLHAIDIVVGDLSPKNLLFKLDPVPRCFLIDCDASRLSGQTVLAQVETPDWEAPAGESKATTATDSYKFGLLAIRLFARDQSVRAVSALTDVSAELGQLATRCLQPDPQSRPSPEDWTRALDSALAREHANTIQAATVAAALAPVAPMPQAATTITAPPRVAANRIGVSMPVVATPGAPLAPPVTRPPPTTGPPPRRRGPAVLVGAAAALAVLLLIIAGVVHAHLQSTGGTTVGIGTSGSNGSNSSGDSSSGDTSTSGNSPSTPPPPPHAGIVQFGDTVQGNSQTALVARMFNNYFSGINDREYQRSVNVFAPSSPIVNPNSPLSEPAFAKADRTSQDTDVTLTNLDPAGGSLVTSAEVTFQSTQAAGLGPRDAPYETCTQWDITFQLTTSPSGQYQIYDTTSDVDSPC
ncbi:MAG TPA: hypothetical protein VGM14_10975 [Streptosporangiaceae bacterium]|jgi:hypothetical protein